MRKPDIVGIGAQKAGTSWLAQMLGQHPQVWATPFKEAHFFNYRFIPGQRYWIDWHYRSRPQEIRQRHARRGIPVPPQLEEYLTGIATSKRIYSNHWYKQIFAPAPEGTLAMDFTPEYSTLPEEGVEFVAKFLPNARFLYLIRHPVDRAISQLRMNLRRERRTPRTVADWIAETRNEVLDQRGDYAAYIPRWQRRLGKRLLILPYGQIAADPEALISRVEDHLGIGPYPYAHMRERVFAGPAGLDPPPEAVAALSQRLAPQVDYLRETFGTDFLDLTR